MKYYMTTPPGDRIGNITFHNGVNIDNLCDRMNIHKYDRGITFTNEGILGQMFPGRVWLWEVAVPSKEIIYIDPAHPADFKAKKVVLSNRERITNDVIMRLIEEGADVNCGGYHLFCKAASNGDIDLVNYLLSKGIDISFAGPLALSGAAEGGHADIVRLLLDLGINPDHDYCGALYCASSAGNIDVVKMLLEHGANVNPIGNNPLVWAVKHGHIKTVKMLIEHGADPGYHHSWALYEARLNDDNEVAKLLMSAGADPEDMLCFDSYDY